MGEKTDKLEKTLENVSPENIGKFLDDNWEDMLDGEKEFTKFVRSIIKKKGLKKKTVYLAANVSESYGEQIIDMSKHTTNRDVIIRICLAAKFNLEETQHALTLYGMQPLYPRNPRDAILIVAINHRKYELSDIDVMLEDQGCELISGKAD